MDPRSAPAFRPTSLSKPLWRDSRFDGLRRSQHEALAARLDLAFSERSVAHYPRSEDGTFNKDAWRSIRAAGAIGVSSSIDIGGQGLGVLGTIIVQQSAHQTLDCGLSSALRIQNEIVAHWLLASRSPYIRERFLHGVADGSLIASVAQTERSHIWYSSAVINKTTVTINAAKALVVNFVNSDLLVVTARVGTQVAAFVVPSDTSGISFAQHKDRWGARLVDQVDLNLNGVTVPLDNMLTFNSFHSSLAWNRVMCRARLTLALDAYAVLIHLIEAVIAHSSNRQVYIDGEPHFLADITRHRVTIARAIGDALRLRTMLVDVALEIEAGRFSVHRAASLRWLAVDRAIEFARYCFELRGGRAYLMSDVFHQLYAQVAGLAMSGGSQEALLTIIAKGSGKIGPNNES